MTTQEKIIEILKKRLHGTHPVYDLYGTTEIFKGIASEIAPMIDKRDAIIDFLIATFDIDINNDPELRQKIEILKSELNK